MQKGKTNLMKTEAQDKKIGCWL